MEKKGNEIWIDDIRNSENMAFPGTAPGNDGKAEGQEAEAGRSGQEAPQQAASRQNIQIGGCVSENQNPKQADAASGIQNRQQAQMAGQPAVMGTPETMRLKENFGFVAPRAFAYAVFYAFCMFRNGSGITFPFFVAGSLLFFYSLLSKLEITLKKGSCFYMVAMLLLGVSTFCTDDGFLIFFNKLGAFLLLMSFLLKQFFDTSKWKLGKYLGSICWLLFGSIGELGRLFSDGSGYFKKREKKTDKRIWYFAIGLLAGVPLLLIVLLLLASADAVFRQMTKHLILDMDIVGMIDIVFRITALFIASYALTAYLCKRKIREDVADLRKGEPIPAITAAGLLTALYLLFSGIQIAGLFLGRLQLPAGYTYAMYAREGFFQLLAVSLLNLVIVLSCMCFFRESRALKWVLTVMSLCTFVMIASSAMRMVIYIRYYYLTYLRILVLWALALLALLFVGVLAHIWREDFPLFRYHMAVVAVMYLALSFAHPDYLIARVNLANASARIRLSQAESRSDIFGGGKGDRGNFFLARKPYQDYSYLGGLSADAAPVLVPYLRELGYDMEAFDAENAVRYAEKLDLEETGAGDGQVWFGYYWMRRLQQRTENFGVRTYNVSRHAALHCIEGMK